MQSDQLRDGVKQAIEALGTGFFTSKDNAHLLGRLRGGQLSAEDYYRQLLRLVYRLLFLLITEAKETESGHNMLHPPGTPAAIRERYARRFSVSRIRGRDLRARGTQRGPLYASLKVLFVRLRKGYAPLGIPRLGSFLFSRASTPDLDAAVVDDAHVLAAIHCLRPVDFASVGSTELGSIYESLLELVPRIDAKVGDFALGTAAGHERKSTGSYYTPRRLIDCLLDLALDPVVERALDKPDRAAAESALLNLKICDPACGTGNFLIAAAQRLALRLAQLRAGEDRPTPSAVQQAKREIIGRCLYGVDVSPMAVELCKVSLWLEAEQPGLPLSFMGDRVQCGNSLLGTTPRLLAGGIPDEAFAPTGGDDKQVCAQLRRQNRHQRTSGSSGAGNPQPANAGQLADAWCAAFVWRKDESDLGRLCPTNRACGRLSRRVRKEIERLREHYQFFHWHLAFPDVYGPNGGFDVVLGNPPYGATHERHVRNLLNFKHQTARPVANSAADFLASGWNLLARDGRLGFVVPKSLTYSFDWRLLRAALLPHVQAAIDVSQAWNDVLLEQILLVVGSGAAKRATVGSLDRQGAPLVAALSQSAAAKLGTLPTGLDRQDLRLLRLLLGRTEHALGRICTTQRGTGLQRLAREAGSVPILGGRNLASFGVRNLDRYVDPAKGAIDETALRKMSPPQAVFQNIVAHIQKPQPHIRLIGAVCQEPYACLDTVNLLTPRADCCLSPYGLAGLLMSDLINWFVYVCVYNRAVRTMHFDGYFLDKIPAPPEHNWPAIHRAALRVARSPLAAAGWRELNQTVYNAYAIPPELAAGVAAMHKPRHL